MKLSKILPAFFLLFCFTLTNAQEKIKEIKLNPSFNQKDFIELLQFAEKNNNIRFFYNEAWLKSIKVKQTTQGQNLNDVIKQSLEGTSLDYMFEPPAYVIFYDKSNIKAYEKRTFKRPLKLYGYVYDGETGAPVPGASVFVSQINKGTVTNQSGFFEIDVFSGKYAVSFQSVGLEKTTEILNIDKVDTLEINLYKEAITLDEINIRADAADMNISEARTGLIKLDIKTIKQLPSFFGEADIIRNISLLPGVNTGGELSSGIHVRGGSADQNLILFDDAAVFHSNHLFGFFSVFNPGVVEGVTLYKGGIPASYGGRLASVLEIDHKEGNDKDFSAKGSIGPLFSRMTVEGPIAKEKASYIFGGRISYVDWALGLFPDVDIKNSKAGFYDLNGKINYKLNQNNRIFVSTYTSHDDFNLASDTSYTWNTLNMVANWKHIFNTKLFTEISGIYCSNKNIIESAKGLSTFKMETGIDQLEGKAEINFVPSVKHKFKAGASTIKFLFNPGHLKPGNSDSFIHEIEIADKTALESAFFFEHQLTFGNNHTLLYGIRYSMYQQLGSAKVYDYEADTPKSEVSISDTAFYNEGEIAQQYSGFEPRISLKINTGSESSLKFSYNRIYQYIHFISNTTTQTPTDIWHPSTKHLKPQVCDQFSTGFFKNFNNNAYETSIELYYKFINNSVDYKNGADIYLNEYLEADLLQGSGQAYGIELHARKNKGRLTGWISYAFARSEQQIDGKFMEEKINNGNPYPTNYDIPHDLSMVANYSISRRWKFAANFVYTRGRPFTAPTSKYRLDNIVVIPNFTNRNQERIPDYHRLDIAFTLLGNHKKNKKWDSSWTFSLYNVYFRKNAYSVFYKHEIGQPPMAYRMAIIGVAVPALTYNFKF